MVLGGPLALPASLPRILSLLLLLPLLLPPPPQWGGGRSRQCREWGGEEKRGAPCSAREGQGCAAEGGGGRRGGGSGQLVGCSALRRGGLAEGTPAHPGPLLPPIVVGFPPGPKAGSAESFASWIKLPPPPILSLGRGLLHTRGWGFRTEEAAGLLLGHKRERPTGCIWNAPASGSSGCFSREAGGGGQRARFGPAPCKLSLQDSNRLGGGGGRCSCAGPWRPLWWEVRFGGAPRCPPLRPTREDRLLGQPQAGHHIYPIAAPFFWWASDPVGTSAWGTARDLNLQHREDQAEVLAFV